MGQWVKQSHMRVGLGISIQSDGYIAETFSASHVDK